MGFEFKLVTRNPEQKLIVHRHHHRTLAGPIHSTPHYMMWHFHRQRNQWEAVCECQEIIFYAVSTADDVEFRKGRSW